MDRSLARVLAATAARGPSEPVAVLRTGRAWTVATEPVEVVSGTGPEAFDALHRVTGGFWAGFCAYELGHAVEQVRPGPASAGGARPVPDVLWVRFARRQTIPDRPAGPPGLLAPATVGPPPGLGAAATSLDRTRYVAAVETILEHIRAGDCYQVNLTRTLTWHRPTEPVALFAAVVTRHPAPHAALLRLPLATGTVAVVSASPERFLAWRGRDVETRPIKGTAPTPTLLGTSAKDRAENVMIVDLARNDLGRVCDPGSVHVPSLCAMERHPGLVHLVSTVRGRLRRDAGPLDLLRATFPPASVTGAPKPRVLQIVEDLETVPRGVYCGAVGWIDADAGCGDLAVAIRTYCVTDGRTTLGVGSGIVADSIPEREWDETCLKARRLLALAGAHEEPAREGGVEPPVGAGTARGCP